MSEHDFAISSLMDLAAFDTSELEAQTTRLPMEGIYIADITAGKLSEQKAQDPADPSNWNLNFGYTILQATPLKEEDAERAQNLEGKNLSERYFIYGKDVKSAVEFLMGRYKIAGFKHKGIMGGVEGSAPGWIEESIGKRVAIRVRHFTRKGSDEPQAAFDWMGVKALEKSGAGWELMQRPFLDGFGTEILDAEGKAVETA